MLTSPISIFIKNYSAPSDFLTFLFIREKAILQSQDHAYGVKPIKTKVTKLINKDKELLASANIKNILAKLNIKQSDILKLITQEQLK